MRPPPTQNFTNLDDGLRMSWYDWAGPAEAPVVLLVHATGFHARCWDAVVELLPQYRVIAVDMRGHGHTDNGEPVPWDRFGEDLADFVRRLGLVDLIGVGHSMGGFCVTWAAAMVPSAFARLLLVDPVILPPEAYAARSEIMEGEHPTAKRRDRWRDAAEMLERFSDRMPFAGWEPRVLRDYCAHGLVPAADGDGFVLACPPRMEASIYMGSAGRDIYELVAQVATPVTVLRAKNRSADRDTMDFSSSPTWPALASRFPDARDVHLAEHSHFIPMEASALTAEYVRGER